MTTKTTQRTARELTPAIGQRVNVRFEQLAIECTVMDAKNSWGKVRLLVQPVAGRGQQWIELERLVSPSPAVTDAEYEATVMAALSHYKGIR